jgi:hypothetical protein
MKKIVNALHAAMAHGRAQAGIPESEDDGKGRGGFSGVIDKIRKHAADQQKMKKGGMVKSSASKRADGCAQRGKTKGRMV